jgi:GNAT superfamily N-acetyltransferase
VTTLSALTAAWVHGWCVSRGAPPPVAIPGGFRLEVGSPKHPVRYVLHSHDRCGLAELGRELVAPGTEIKVVGATASLRAALPDDWSMYPPNNLMTVAFTRATAEVRAPYSARIDTDGAVIAGVILDGDGEIASSAHLAPAGRYGVIDQVWTRRAHQRRGLGSALMAMLGNHALAAGLTTGLLSASGEGRSLYAALGWALHDELAGAVRS